MKRILIMAGGTGGHVIPALTVADYLQSQGVAVHWLGTRGRLEEQLVPAANIPITYIDVVALRGKRLTQLVNAPFRLLRACYQAMRAILQFKPDAILGMGGFAAGPGGVAAWLLRKPLIIHEQNAVAGLTNQVLAHLATTVLQAIPGAFEPKFRAITVGNPVRLDILNLPDPATRFANHINTLRILVLGGSQGAAAINNHVPLALAILHSNQQHFEVWHQAGKQHDAIVTANYEKLGLTARVSAFIDDMAAAYAWADIVICRAGALTIAELAAAGVGSVLIPFPFASDNHQVINARFLVQAGAAILLEEKALTAIQLAKIIENLLTNPSQRLTMARAARRLCVKSAAAEIGQHCMKFGVGQ